MHKLYSFIYYLAPMRWFIERRECLFWLMNITEPEVRQLVNKIEITSGVAKKGIQLSIKSVPKLVKQNVCEYEFIQYYWSRRRDIIGLPLINYIWKCWWHANVLANNLWLPPIISRTGKATDFKFCTQFHTMDNNKRPFTISGKVVVGVAREGLPKFFRASIII